VNRPILTAEWRHLLMLNFRVEPQMLAPFVPRGTQLDLHDGRAYVSLVGFSFLKTRLWGLRVPCHGNFPEVNLRMYVCRKVGDELRRGVVFLREIVPRQAVAAVANSLYREDFVCRPMSRLLELDDQEVEESGAVEYAWRHAEKWHRMAARRAGRWHAPQPGSLEEFIVEHYWGYNGTPARAGHEYAVRHRPWGIAAVDDVVWQCDVAAVYGQRWADAQADRPENALLADGSAVIVYRARRIE